MPKIEELKLMGELPVVLVSNTQLALMQQVFNAAIEDAERYSKIDLNADPIWKDFALLRDCLFLNEAQSKALVRLQNKVFRKIRQEQRTAAVRAVLEVTGGE